MKKTISTALTIVLIVLVSFFTVKKSAESKSISTENIEALGQVREGGPNDPRCQPVASWFCSGTVAPMLFYNN